MFMCDLCFHGYRSDYIVLFAAGQRLMSPPAGFPSAALRSPTAIGAPLILPPRVGVPTTQGHMISAAGLAPPPLISPTETLMYPYEYQYLTPTLLEYQQLDHHHGHIVPHPHPIGGLLTR